LKLGSTRLELLKLGYSYGKFFLKVYPYVKLLAISGSLSNPNYVKHNDVDFFIVSRRGHVWDALIISIIASRLYSKVIGVDSELFCFNYVIDEDFVLKELNFDKKSAWEFLNLLIISGHTEYLRIALRKSKVLTKMFKRKFYRRIKRLLNPTHSSEFGSGLGRISSFILMLLGKLLAIVLRPLIKYREKFWKRVLKELGFNYQKFYSNKYVYRRHKK